MILYQKDNKTITQIFEQKIYICSKCGLPGTMNPVVVDEFGSKYMYHPECIYDFLASNGGKLPKLNESIDKSPAVAGQSKKKAKVKKIIEDRKATEESRLKSKRIKWKKVWDASIILKEIKRAHKRTAKMDYIDEKIVIDVPYSKQTVSRFHYLNIKFDRLNKRWEIQKFKDFELLNFLYNINREMMQYHWVVTKKASKFLSDSLQKFSEDYDQYRSILDVKKLKTTEESFKEILKIEPFGYQKVGIMFLERANGIAIIGDAMGLGKTLQALGYTAKHELKTIVVCPSSVKFKWAREIKKFTHKSSVILSEVSSDTESIFKHDYIIVNYAQLKKHEKVLSKAQKAGFNTIVLDESQYMQSNKAQRTKLIFSLFKKYEKRILLSGTPVKNRPIDFFTQLKFVKPEIFKKKTSFGLRYADAEYNEFRKSFDYKGASNLRELYIKIDTFFIRRLKQDVLKELPQKSVSVLDVKLKVAEYREYHKLIRNIKKDTINLSLTKFIKLQQILSMKKVDMAVELVAQMINEDPDRKVVLFSQFIATQKKLLEIFGSKASSLLGSYPAKRREKEQLEFNKNPDKRVFIGSTKAAGIGIDLTAADTVIFLDLMFSPTDMEQAEDRTHRIGQKDPVSVFYLNYKDTIDEYLWDILRIKLDILGQLLEGKDPSLGLDQKTVKANFLRKVQENYSMVVPESQ